MVKNNHKKGFSFAEILVSMLILSLFFLAGAKVFTRKEKPEVMKKVHGFYECYWNGGDLYQAMSKFGSRPTPVKVNGSCVFATTKNNSLFDITILFPNRGGVYYDQQFINTEQAFIVPPRQGDPVGVITDSNGKRTPIDQGNPLVHKNEEMDYSVVKNNLELNSKNANVLSDDISAGDTGKNGAIIISW